MFSLVIKEVQSDDIFLISFGRLHYLDEITINIYNSFINENHNRNLIKAFEVAEKSNDDSLGLEFREPENLLFKKATSIEIY